MEFVTGGQRPAYLTKRSVHLGLQRKPHVLVACEENPTDLFIREAGTVRIGRRPQTVERIIKAQNAGVKSVSVGTNGHTKKAPPKRKRNRAHDPSSVLGRGTNNGHTKASGVSWQLVPRGADRSAIWNSGLMDSGGLSSSARGYVTWPAPS